MELDCDRRAAEGIRRRGVGQRAVRSDGRSCRKQCGVGVAGDLESQRLAGFIRRARRNVCGPVVHSLRAGVFVDRLIGALRK